MKVLYIATADIAVPGLEALHGKEGIDVVGVVCQPDRPRGRRRRLSAAPVKERAGLLGLPVISPEKIGSPEVVETLQAWEPDLNVVFAYGQYLPGAVTDMPRLRSINIHPSLLPRHRGASPIQFTILNGDAMGGISVIYVTKEMDSGDILLQKRVPLATGETSASLSGKMAGEAATILCEALDLLVSGDAHPQSQDPARVTETRKLTKEDGPIDWSLSAQVLDCRVRAFNPWPCATFQRDGLTIKLHRVGVEDGKGPPGEVLDVKGGPLIATGDGAVRLLDVQPPGKKAMPGDAWLRGYPLAVGDRLG
jgi:methionyl-tRNA formyltransferase